MYVLLCRLLQQLEAGSPPVNRQHVFHQFAGYHQSGAVSITSGQLLVMKERQLFIPVRRKFRGFNQLGLQMFV